MSGRCVCGVVVLVLIAFGHPALLGAETSLQISEGPLNSVVLRDGDHKLVIYGDDGQAGQAAASAKTELLLLTHGRREVLRKVVPLSSAGVPIVAPAREKFAIEMADEFWKTFPQTRFHDYAQQSIRIPVKALPVSRWVSDGDVVEWRGLQLKCLETPGYTRGSVTWLLEHNGKKHAFTGDLIYGDGRIPDLFSFQDAINEAQIRGYHGFGSRLADLVASLRRLEAENPDVLVPIRGPIIQNPKAAIQKLISRVQAVYGNYLSTNALHWYFGADRMKQCGQRVLGADAEIQLMPFSEHQETPSWIYENSTSRLLISESGSGFLLDCGYQRVIDSVKELIDQGVITKVEGVFVTHIHDDHTDMVQAAAEAFQCPVYALEEYADVLEHPEAWHLPALTNNPVKTVTQVRDGHHIKWHEFDLTFHFFPGQTFYHGALLAEKPDERPVFFVGDSFAPTGFDDYCVQNRNLLHDDQGYLLCLSKFRSLKRPFWIVNEHINHVFAFTTEELDYLERQYRLRIEMLRELFPWDDPNYGVDEHWATFYPHGLTVPANASTEMQVRIMNHSPVTRTFTVRPHLPTDVESTVAEFSVTVPPHAEGHVKIPIQVGAATGDFVVTADIVSEGIHLYDWAEAQISVR